MMVDAERPEGRGSAVRETYRLAITISGKIDPDDRRGVAEQAEEWLDGLVYWINDTCPGAVWAELVAVGGADGRVGST